MANSPVFDNVGVGDNGAGAGADYAGAGADDNTDSPSSNADENSSSAGSSDADSDGSSSANSTAPFDITKYHPCIVANVCKCLIVPCNFTTVAYYHVEISKC